MAHNDVKRTTSVEHYITFCLHIERISRWKYNKIVSIVTSLNKIANRSMADRTIATYCLWSEEYYVK